VGRKGIAPTTRLEAEIFRTWGIVLGGCPAKKRKRLYWTKLTESPIIPYKKSEISHSDSSHWWQQHSGSDSEPKHVFLESFMHLGEGFAQGYRAPGEDRSFVLSRPRDSDAKLRYSGFPIYGERLRILRAYMDDHKPQNLRQLLIDNRDKLSYYTFVVAVFAGTVTVLLAFSTVVIAITQTVAAYRALKL
jgi:hypothetical protein